ncbi:MAG: hypothetical protein CME98_12475 [Hyphomonas sp.]|nr:hypothetical protein [Hyphomonas sp.]
MFRTTCSLHQFIISTRSAFIGPDRPGDARERGRIEDGWHVAHLPRDQRTVQDRCRICLGAQGGDCVAQDFPNRGAQALGGFIIAFRLDCLQEGEDVARLDARAGHDAQFFPCEVEEPGFFGREVSVSPSFFHKNRRRSRRTLLWRGRFCDTAELRRVDSR